MLVALPIAARAQSPPSVVWRASAGYDQFAFRDVAKSRPPVDASPVRWRGRGPIVTFEYERVRPLRLLQVEVTASTAGDFQYETGVGVAARPRDDSASFVEGHYDYRRYLARPIVVRGLSAGVGVRGIGERRLLRHHFDDHIELTETNVASSIAAVASLRFRRIDRVAIDAEWTNGATLARGRQRHVDAVINGVSEIASWGGGWLTDVAARAELGVARHAAVLVSYLRRGEGRLFDLRAYTAERRRVMVGVTYAP